MGPRSAKIQAYFLFLPAFIGILVAVFTPIFFTKGIQEKNKNEIILQSRKTIEIYAKEDFDTVLKGKKPIHAIPDEGKPDLTDGGTSFYKGNGYSLTIKSTISEENGINGYIYGPIITFHDKTKKEMSEIRFYSVDELKKLRSDITNK